MAGGVNPFAYVRANPVNLIDPYGLYAMALTPYAYATAPVLVMADSPLLPFGDALAGALIGLAWLHDTMPDGPPESLGDDSGGSCPNGEDPDDDSRIANHAIERGHFKGKSVKEVKSIIQEVRSNGTRYNAGNGNSITRWRNNILIDDHISPNSRGTIFTREGNVSRYIQNYLRQNR